MEPKKVSAKDRPKTEALRQKREIRRRKFYEAVDNGELNLREAIREFRLVLGLNQRDFAKFVGVSPRIIMAFEQGHGNPTLETLEKMLKGSGLTLRLGRKQRPENLSTKVGKI